MRGAAARYGMRGFTLVELVVVIALIVTLAALILGVGMAVVQGSEERQTRGVLELLDTAVLEWQARSDRQVTFGKINEPLPGAAYELVQPDVYDDSTADTLTRQYVVILQRVAAVRDILAQVSSGLVASVTVACPQNPLEQCPTLTFKDTWGKAIVVVLPGRPWVDGDDGAYERDDDGTIRTEIETRFGPAQGRRACFVSAGPDGKYGDFNAGPGDAELGDTRDNVYSYVPTVTAQP